MRIKIGLLAGNRTFPVLFSKRAKEYDKNIEIVAVCFKGETSPLIGRFADKVYWTEIGRIKEVLSILKKENIVDCVMAGQISPFRVFRQAAWDDEMKEILRQAGDKRPHSIFGAIISRMEDEGIKFYPSTLYMDNDLSKEGVMNGLAISETVKKDIDFGLNIMRGYRDLDVGQTVAVYRRAAIALEGFEGTDKTILRAYRTVRGGCSVLKFSKSSQDLRFDVPIVGIKTLAILRKIKAASLVLESGKVIILEKEKFINLSKLWKIPVVGVRL